MKKNDLINEGSESTEINKENSILKSVAVRSIVKAVRSGVLAGSVASQLLVNMGCGGKSESDKEDYSYIVDADNDAGDLEAGDGCMGIEAGDGCMGIEAGDGCMGIEAGDGCMGIDAGDGCMGVEAGDGCMGVDM